MEQIICRHRCREQLAEHRGDRRTHHTPFEHENKYWIENNIDHRARDRRHHRKAGASVRADDRIHRLTENIDGDAQGYPEEIFFRERECFFVDRAAEHGDKFIRKNQI